MTKVLLSVLGAIFVAAGLGLFAWLCRSTWGYAGRTEYAMGLLLLGCAAFGVALLAAARPAVRRALNRIRRRPEADEAPEGARAQTAEQRAGRVARAR